MALPFLGEKPVLLDTPPGGADDPLPQAQLRELHIANRTVSKAPMPLVALPLSHLPLTTLPPATDEGLSLRWSMFSKAKPMARQGACSPCVPFVWPPTLSSARHVMRLHDRERGGYGLLLTERREALPRRSLALTERREALTITQRATRGSRYYSPSDARLSLRLGYFFQ